MKTPKNFKKICKGCKHFKIEKLTGLKEKYPICTVRGKNEHCAWNHNAMGVCFNGKLYDTGVKAPKNMSELCSALAKMEAGKSQVSIGNIREIMRCLADLMAETNKEPLDIIAKYAANRANSRRKK